MRIVERLQATVYRVLLSASAVDQDVRNDADDAVKATVALLKQAEAALEECRDRFAEYVKMHSAKLLPERHPDEFYQHARTSHNDEVREKIARNQEMADLCDALLAKLHEGGE